MARMAPRPALGGHSLAFAVLCAFFFLLTSNLGSANILIRKAQGPFAIPEAESAIYVAQLLVEPTDNVSVAIETLNRTVFIPNSELTMIAGDEWDQASAFEIYAVDDRLIRPSPYTAEVEITTSSGDSNFQLPVLKIVILLSERDQGGLVVELSDWYPFPDAIPEGRYADYDLSLPTQPYADVHVVAAEANDGDWLQLEPSSFSFTPLNWNISQRMRVHAIDNSRAETSDVVKTAIAFNLSSTDESYNNGSSVAPLEVWVEDNDEPVALVAAGLSWQASRSDFRVNVQFALQITTDANVTSQFDVPMTFRPTTSSAEQFVSLAFTALHQANGWTTATATFNHSYDLTNLRAATWIAQFQTCCRSEALASNAGTTVLLTTRISIPTTNVYRSPAIPVLPVLHMPASHPSTIQLSAPASSVTVFSLVGTEGYQDARSGPTHAVSLDVTAGQLLIDPRAWDMDGQLHEVLVQLEDVATGATSVVGIPFILDAATSAAHPLTLGYEVLPWYFAPANSSVDIELPGRNCSLASLNTDAAQVLVNPQDAQGYITATLTPAFTGYETICFDCDASQAVVCAAFLAEAPTSLHDVQTAGLTVSTTFVSGTAFEPLSLLELTDNGHYLQYVTLSLANDGAYNASLASSVTESTIEVATLSDAALVMRGPALASSFQRLLRRLRFTVTAPDGQDAIQLSGFLGVRTTSSYDVHHVHINLTRTFPAPALDLDLMDRTATDGNSRVLYLDQDHETSVNLFLSENVLLTGHGDRISATDVRITNAIDTPNEVLAVTYHEAEPLLPPIVIESGRVDMAIEDATVTEHTLLVADSFLPSRVEVILDLRHSYIGDLRIELQHDGITIALAEHPGGVDCSADDLIGVKFSSHANFSLSPGSDESEPGICQTHFGSLVSPAGNLDRFLSTNTAGNWTLRVYDTAEEDTGALYNWDLVFHRYVVNSSTFRHNSQLFQWNFGPALTLSGTSPLQLSLDALGALGDVQIWLSTSVPQNTVNITLKKSDVTVHLNSASGNCSGRQCVYISGLTPATVRQPAVVRNSTQLQNILRHPIEGSWLFEISMAAEAGDRPELLAIELVAAVVPNVNVSFDATSAHLELHGIDAAAAYEELLQSVTYSNSHTNITGDVLRTLNVSVSTMHGARVSKTASISVHHLNPVNLTSILEDEVDSAGDSVQSIVTHANSPEIDFLTTRDLLGIAVVHLDTTHGHWEYRLSTSGSWISFPVCSTTNATLLDRLAAVRFVPVKDFHETAALGYVLWDVTQDEALAALPSGTHDIDIAQNTVVFPPQIGTATIRVLSVNDSPRLFPGVAMSSYDEDVRTVENLGDAVDDIVSGYYLDVDQATPSGEDAVVGIAIVGADSTYGTWQYSCNGVSYTNIFGNRLADGSLYPRDPSPTQATLLGAACTVRFLPVTNFNTDVDANGNPWTTDVRPCLVIKGWDNTGATRGQQGKYGVDTTATYDGTGEFSLNTSAACIQFFSVNDSPSIVGTGPSTETVREDNRYYPLVFPDNWSLEDPDDLYVSYMYINMTAPDGSQESLATLTLYTAPANLVVNGYYGSNMLHLILSGNNTHALTRAQATAAAKALVYTHELEEPTSGLRTLSIQIMDNDGARSNIYQQSWWLANDNDAPVLNVSLVAGHYVEGGVQTALAAVTLQDNDNATQVQAEVVLTNPLDGQDDLLRINSTIVASTFPALTVTYDNNTHTLTITGEDSLANYVALLSQVEYYNSRYDYDRGNPTAATRVITVRTFDGIDWSNTAESRITFEAVNDEPYIDLDSASAASQDASATFVEESDGVLIAPLATMFDIDNATLAAVRLTISNPLDGADESLGYTPFEESEAAGNGQTRFRVVDPGATYDAVSNSLTLTGLDTVLDYTHILNLVYYVNQADEPDDTTRQVVVEAWDGLAWSTPRTVSVAIAMLNDSPRFTGVAPVALAIDEDVVSSANPGLSTFVVLSSNAVLEDDDRSSLYGLAVVGVDQANGLWQYRLTSAAAWTTMFSVSVSRTSAVLLPSSSDVSIRFVPDANFHGAATLTVVAWDQSDAGTPGAMVDATYAPDGRGAFSSATTDIVVNVAPVNDAPTFTSAGVRFQLHDIPEDDAGLTASTWNRVWDVLNGSGIADVDDGSSLQVRDYGLAVTAVDATHGSWSASVDGGSSWIDLTSVAPDHAFVMASAPTSSMLIRFVPEADYHESSTLTYAVWDGSDGATPGTYVDVAAADAVTGAYSTTRGYADIQVLSVNDPPTIVSSKTATMVEDSPSQLGTRVDVLFDQAFADVDNTDFGVAVVASPTTYGVWYYRCSEMASFTAMVGDVLANGQVFPTLPSQQFATLLNADCRIRFVPTTNFNTQQDTTGTAWPGDVRPFLTVHAWDMTTPTTLTKRYGHDLSATLSSSSSPFSSSTTQLRMAVTSVNDLPIFSSTILSHTFMEEQDPLDIVPTSVTVADADNALCSQVQLSMDRHDFADLLHWTPAANENVAIVVNTSTSLVMTITSSTNSLSMLRANTILHELVFVNNLNEPSAGERLVTIIITDAVGGSTVPLVIDIAMALVNDPPILDLDSSFAGEVAYADLVEGASVMVAPAATLQDNDNATQVQAEVVLTNPLDGQDDLLRINSTIVASTFPALTVTYDNNTHTLTITGEDSLANYVALLSQVEYYNSRYDYDRGNPTAATRVITVRTFDGIDWSNTAESRITFEAVNDEPYIDLDSASAASQDASATFVEESDGVLIAPLATMFDIDNATLAAVRLTISNPLDGADESLGYTPFEESEAAGNGQTRFRVVDPGATYDAVSNSLTLTGLDTVLDYTHILNLVYYVNQADEPDDTTRQVVVEAWDGLAWSTPRTVSVAIAMLNDSPRFTGVAPVALAIDEDVVSSANPGLSTFVVLSSNAVLEDDDRSSLYGLAVVGVDQANGLWQYRLTSAAAWTTMFSVSVSRTSAVLLPSSSDVSIRFVPDANFHGAATLTVVAWDQSDAGTPGAMVDATYAPDGRGAFSSATTDIVVNVAPVNDAPTFTSAGVRFQLHDIPEDDAGLTASTWNRVWDVLNGSGIADVDDGSSLQVRDYGLAVTAVDATHGSWSASVDGGSSWIDLTSVAPDHAFVMASAPTSSMLIRFVPEADYHESSTLTYAVWDGSDGATPGTYVDVAAADAVTGAYSTTRGYADIQVLSVNDSPVLINGSYLEAIHEDDLANNGTSLPVLVRSSYYDVDRATPSGHNSTLGLAITQIDQRFGAWQYSCDGVTFKDFVGGILINGQVYPPRPLTSSATLLGPECRIRFVPAANFNTEFDLAGRVRAADDTPYLIAKGWDHTDGRVSGSIAVDTTEATTAFSALSARITQSVVSVNDPPVIFIGGASPPYTAVYVEGATPVSLAVNHSAHVVDVDNANLTRLAVTLDGIMDGANEQLVFSNWNIETSSPIDVLGFSIGVTCQRNSSTLRCEAMGLDNQLPVTAASAFLQHLAYVNVHPEPHNGTRSVSVLADDGIDVTQRSISVSVQLIAENKPVLQASQPVLQFTEQGGPLGLSVANLTLRDEDHNNYYFVQSAMLALTSPDQSLTTDRLSVDCSTNGINAQFNTSTYALSLSGVATIQEYQTCLNSVVFSNEEAEPAGFVREVLLTVTDDASLTSVPLVLTIEFQLVNDNAPLFDIVDRIVFYEDFNTTLFLGDAVAVTDADEPLVVPMTVNASEYARQFMYDNLTVSVTNPQYAVGTEYVSLWYMDQVRSGSVVVIPGPVSLATVNDILSTLAYHNDAEETLGIPRTVRFELQDSVGVYEGDLLVTIRVHNDRPIASNLQGPVPTFVEDESSVLLFGSSLSLDDNDNATLASVSLTLVAPVDGVNETLLLLNEGQHVNISAQCVAGSGCLLLGPASLRNFEAALRDMAYQHRDGGDPTPGQRLINIVLHDGLRTSILYNASVLVQAVNDAPVVLEPEATLQNVTFIEEGPAVAVFPSPLEFYDADNTVASRITLVLNSSREEHVLLANRLSWPLLSAQAVCEEGCAYARTQADLRYVVNNTVAWSQADAWLATAYDTAIFAELAALSANRSEDLRRLLILATVRQLDALEDKITDYLHQVDELGVYNPDRITFSFEDSQVIDVPAFQNDIVDVYFTLTNPSRQARDAACPSHAEDTPDCATAEQNHANAHANAVATLLEPADLLPIINLDVFATCMTAELADHLVVYWHTEPSGLPFTEQPPHNLNNSDIVSEYVVDELYATLRLNANRAFANQAAHDVVVKALAQVLPSTWLAIFNATQGLSDHVQYIMPNASSPTVDDGSGSGDLGDFSSGWTSGSGEEQLSGSGAGGGNNNNDKMPFTLVLTDEALGQLTAAGTYLGWLGWNETSSSSSLYMGLIDSSLQNHYGYHIVDSTAAIHFVNLSSDVLNATEMALINEGEACPLLCERGLAASETATQLRASCVDACFDLGDEMEVCQIGCTLARASLKQIIVASNATLLEAAVAIGNVHFVSYRDEEIEAQVPITLQIVDPEGLAGPQYTVFVELVPVNDAPRLLALVNGSVNYVEDATPIPLFSLALSDADDTTVSLIRVELLDATPYESVFVPDLPTTGPSSPAERAAAIGSDYERELLAQNLTDAAAWVRAGAVLELYGPMSLTDAVQLIERISYYNLQHDTAFDAPRVLNLMVLDPHNASSNLLTTNVTVLATDNVPLAQVAALPVLEEALEDTASVLFDPRPYFLDAEARPNATDAYDTLTTEIVATGAWTNASLDGAVIRFTPLTEDYGDRVVTYRVCASGQCSVEHNMTLRLQPVNDAPRPRYPVLNASVVEDTETVLSLDDFYYDVEDYKLEPFQPPNATVEPLTVTIPAAQPSTTGLLSLVLDPDARQVTFTPAENYVGPASIAFSVCDSAGACTNMTLHLTITPVNDAIAVAPAVGLAITEDINTTIEIMASDVEDDACPYNAAITAFCTPILADLIVPPTHGVASLSYNSSRGNHVLTVHPAADYAGPDTIVVQLCDSQALCVNHTIDLTVLPVNDAPRIALRNVTIDEDVRSTLALMPYLSDPDDSIWGTGITVTSLSSNLNVSYDASTDALVLVSALNYFGAAAFQLQVCSTTLPCVQQVVGVQIRPVNDVPVALALNVTVFEDVPQNFPLFPLTSDVENRRRSVSPEDLSIVSFPTHGQVNYSADLGTATYTPDADYFGTDELTYQICDDEGACSRGLIGITVLPVNDPPRLSANYAALLPYDVEEDSMNMVAVYAMYNDPDLPESFADAMTRDEEVALRLDIMVPPAHGEVNPFSQYGIISYDPASDYVGMDSFVFRVCDKCSSERDLELGRIVPSTDPACVRQRDLTFSSEGCLNVTVELRVVNINDAPVVPPLAKITSVNVNAVFDPLAHVSDEDESQYATLLEQNLTPADFGLVEETDLVVTSLSVSIAPSHGVASIVLSNTTYELVYQPDTDFAGADTFSYSICDHAGACTQSRVRVQVATPAPEIASVTVLQACYDLEDDTREVQLNSYTCTGRMDTDARYGALDRWLVAFDRDTNMPPYGVADLVISQSDLERLFQFSPNLTTSTASGAYYGLWRNARELVIVMVDVGYPEPTMKTSRTTFALRASESVDCSGFAQSSEVYEVVTPNRLCLQDAAGLSRHSNASFAGFRGHFGLAFPLVIGANVVQPINVQGSYLGSGTVITMSLQPPLSASTMARLCMLDSADIFDMSVLGSNGESSIECQVVFDDGTVELIDMTETEYRCTFEPESIPASSCGASATSGARRRRDAAGSPSTMQLVMDIARLTNALVDPTDSEALLAALQAGLLHQGMAALVADDTGGNSTELLADFEERLEQYLLDNMEASGVYLRGSPVQTPVISSVELSGSDGFLIAGSTLSIKFDRDTNTPASASEDLTILGSDLDSLLTFSPALCANTTAACEGEWISRQTLVITVHEPDESSAALTNYLDQLRIAFKSTSYEDPCREDPSPCGTASANGFWGVCNRLETSCRASEEFVAAEADASWSSSTMEADGSNLYFLVLLLIVPVLAIVVFWFCCRGSAKQREARRAMRSSKGKPSPPLDAAEVWQKPPASASMRSQSDPFAGSGVPRAPGLRNGNAPYDPFFMQAPQAQTSHDPFADATVAPAVVPVPVPSPFHAGSALPMASPTSPGGTLPPLRRHDNSAMPKTLPALPARMPSLGGNAKRPSFASPSKVSAIPPPPMGMRRPVLQDLTRQTADQPQSLPARGASNKGDPFALARHNSKEKLDPFARPAAGRPGLPNRDSLRRLSGPSGIGAPSPGRMPMLGGAGMTMPSGASAPMSTGSPMTRLGSLKKPSMPPTLGGPGASGRPMSLPRPGQGMTLPKPALQRQPLPSLSEAPGKPTPQGSES